MPLARPIDCPEVNDSYGVHARFAVLPITSLIVANVAGIKFVLVQ